MSWFTITNKASETDIRIFDAIGAFGITADAFVAELAAIKSPVINLHINSPGGEIFAGTAIYNALKDHPAKVVVHVDGVAASAASFIAMAGDEIRIAKNAYVMVHNAMGGAMGYATDLRGVADVLDKLSATIAQTYADRTGKPLATWQGYMADETWFTAQEAIDAGLADSIKNEDAKPSATNFDTRIYNKIPDLVRVAWGVKDTGPSARAEIPATAKQKEPSMTIENFQAFAAEHPEAVASYVEQGKKAGAADAVAQFQLLREACGAEHLDIAANAFEAGESIEHAKTQVSILVKAREEAAKQTAAKDAQIAQLQAQLDAAKAMAAFVQGEQGAVGTKPAAETKPEPKYDSPEAQAEAEFAADENIRKQFSDNKAAYVNFRKAELSGRVTYSKSGK